MSRNVRFILFISPLNAEVLKFFFKCDLMFSFFLLEEKFGDTKVIIKGRKSKKDRQYSGQQKTTDKKANNDSQRIE